LILPLTPAEVQRFWSKVDKQKYHHMWTGTVGKQGYGVINLRGTVVTAPRVVLLLENGVWPKQALHRNSCHTRQCVRLEHLYDGTAQQNVKDQQARGRYPTAKLTASTVQEIRLVYESGMILQHIADIYGINPGTVKQIVNRVTWKDS
jgi:DNA-binding CsgD family transcriptional regulator